MRRYGTIILFLLLLTGTTAGLAENSSQIDSRTDLNLTESEQQEFLSQMRQMLTSIQGIISGIGTEDRGLIARSARDSGNRLGRSTPESVREKLPQAFKDIGGPTHLLFEELAIRAETDDMDMLAEFTGRLMRQCLTCHDMFKAH